MNYLFLLRTPVSVNSYISDKYKILTIEPNKEIADFAGVDFLLNRKFFVSNKNKKQIWKNILKRIENRMKKGSTVIINSIQTNRKSMEIYKELVEKYGYKTVVIDFSNIPLKKLLEINRKKKQYERLPDRIIINRYKELKKVKIPEWVYKTYDGNIYSFENILSDLKNELIKEFDVRKHQRAFVIGDIHGMY
jgi:predicted kinase